MGQGQIPIVHDQNLVLVQSRLQLEYGVARGWGVGLQLPFKLVRAKVRYLDGNGNEVQLVNPDIHHRNETLTGPMDPTVYGRAIWARSGWRYGGRFGLALPLGRTEENPFLLGEQGERHQHIQFGTGTLRPVLGADGSRALGPWKLDASAIAEMSLYTSVKGYRPGHRYHVGVYASSPPGFRRWRYRFGVGLEAETPERWRGTATTEEGNQGRLDVLLSAALTWRLGTHYYVSPSLQVPVYTRVVGAQLEYPVLVGVSIGMVRAEHSHAHGPVAGPPHDEEPESAGLDIAALTDSGELVALDPVPGKITIFDFWAPWCVPCRELDGDLRKIASEHTDGLAIRRVNIVEWESPAAKRYLVPGQFDLPHLKVYDEEGHLLFERSGGAEELAEAVRALFR